MTAVPTTLTAVAGAVLTASQWNTNNRDVENYLLAPPILVVRQTSNQSLTSSSTPSQAITFTTEDVDSSGMHSNVTNTSRCTAVYAGWYDIGGGIAFVASATGSRGASWAVNGTSQNGTFSWLPANGSGFTATPCRRVQLFLNVGDYFEMFGAQTSGGSLNTSVVSNEQSTIACRWVSN